MAESPAAHVRHPHQKLSPAKNKLGIAVSAHESYDFCTSSPCRSFKHDIGKISAINCLRRVQLEAASPAPGLSTWPMKHQNHLGLGICDAFTILAYAEAIAHQKCWSWHGFPTPSQVLDGRHIPTLGTNSPGFSAVFPRSLC